MTPPRDPDGVEPTLLPNAPAAPLNPPARPTAPAVDTPGPFDATIDTPIAPSAPPVDPDATMPHTARTVVPVMPALPLPVEPRSEPTVGGVEPTLMPSKAPVAPAPGTIVGTDPTGAELGATIVNPTGRTKSDEAGPLGTDTAPPSLPPGTTGGVSPSATGTMVGRFALRGLHASGGLGEVFTARDTELNREVAVKRIKSRYADDPGSRSRFLSEATLTARLDHPGVVPVFGLVNDVRGRPCYAMRFIRGETLKDEIDRYYGNQKADKEKTDGTAGGAESVAAVQPGATEAVPRSVAFRHLLARFIATCQAIAYAHKKNIIHRDIKPANIMVGSFGETLVVDWGLAKSLDDGPDFERIQKAAAAAGFRHDPDATELPSHMTSAGTAVGTPAYMAPEQAAGDVHNVGPRADVYSLGATLFVILTGKSPVAGKTTAELLDRVRRGVIEPPLAVNPECPKPLDAIACKAMALRPDDRYATALELAADVERWLSDEPVSCYRDPLFARLARWTRRHPARVATGASLLLAGVLAAGAVALVYQQGEQAVRKERDNVIREQEKTDAALKQVTAQKEKIDEALRTEIEQKGIIETQKVKIDVARAAAVKRYDRAVRAYDILVREVDQKLKDSSGMHSLRKDLLLGAIKGLDQLIAEEGQYSSDRTLVAAYRQMGEVYQLLGNTTEAHKKFKTAVDEARKVKDEASPADKRAADLDLGRSLDKFAGLLMEQPGGTKDAQKAIDEAIDLFAIYAADPKDTEAQKALADAKLRRSNIKMEQADTRGAEKDLKDALVLHKSLVPKELGPKSSAAEVQAQRDYAGSLDAMSVFQLRTGKTAAARDTAAESLAMRLRIADLKSDNPEVVRELADAFARLGETSYERGHMTAAAKAYDDGVKQLEVLKAKDEESAGVKAELAAMYGRLGIAQLRLGEVEKARENTERGRDMALKLQQLDPKSAKTERDLALARERHGDALLASGDFDEGLKEYTKSAEALRPLRDTDLTNVRGQLELARGLERIGDGSVATKDMNGAIVAYKASVAIRSEVYKEAREKDSKSIVAKRDYALGLYKLAEAHIVAGRPADADRFATLATDLLEELSADDPESAQARREVALAYGKWGQVLSAGGHPTGALLIWQNAQAQTADLAKIDGQNTQALEDEAAAWERLAGFYAAIGRTDRAREAADTAVMKWETIAKGIDSKTKAGRRRLALAMLRCGDISVEVKDYPKARKWYEDAAKEANVPDAKLLAPIAQEAADRLEYVNAVKAGLDDPSVLQTYPVPVQLRALPTVARMALRADDVTTAYICATQLASIAPGKDKKFVDEGFEAATMLAGCAASKRGGGLKKDYADEAVAQLKIAVAAGFRNADKLSGPEWDAVRKYTKELDEVKKDLEKQRDAELLAPPKP